VGCQATTTEKKMKMSWNSWNKLFPDRTPELGDEIEVEGEPMYLHSIDPSGIGFATSRHWHEYNDEGEEDEE
jgi:hypothetical protein